MVLKNKEFSNRRVGIAIGASKAIGRQRIQ